MKRQRLLSIAFIVLDDASPRSNGTSPRRHQSSTLNRREWSLIRRFKNLKHQAQQMAESLGPKERRDRLADLCSRIQVRP